jgi:thymidine phosphorylase
VTTLHAGRLGRISVALGAGRTRADENVDPRVGIELCVERGEAVEVGQPLLIVHAARTDTANALLPELYGSVEIGAQPPAEQRRVLSRVH